MGYTSEQELVDAGFAPTVQQYHDGKGIGKIYEKIVDDVRVYFVVESDGVVRSFDSKAGVPVESGDPVAEKQELPPVEEKISDVVEVPQPPVKAKKAKGA